MRKITDQTFYTVVQHSGWGYGKKREFIHGLEPVGCTKKDAQRVELVGGKLFETYKEADEYSYTEQYPEGYKGLLPIAEGTFSRRVVNGLKIYVPKEVKNSNAQLVRSPVVGEKIP
jgi:hypothetical protein|tara:strand:- start:1055 stop:1402 length:348 start_codon:yes stop_codon:yes gene_type:complete